jgi:alpha-beta hydrolase superfamily lysophospholipase
MESSTSDQDYIQTRRNDSLSIHKVSMNYLLKVHEMQRECKKKTQLTRVSVPTLISYGGADKISSLKGSDFLCKNLQNCKTDLIIYPGYRHSVLWEPDSIKAGRDIADWISRNQK